MAFYSLVGQDGNAYSLMGYAAKALREVGLKEEAKQVFKDATTGDYNHLVNVCSYYVEMANDVLRERGERE